MPAEKKEKKEKSPTSKATALWVQALICFSQEDTRIYALCSHVFLTCNISTHCISMISEPLPHLTLVLKSKVGPLLRDELNQTLGDTGMTHTDTKVISR